MLLYLWKFHFRRMSLRHKALLPVEILYKKQIMKRIYHF